MSINEIQQSAYDLGFEDRVGLTKRLNKNIEDFLDR